MVALYLSKYSSAKSSFLLCTLSLYFAKLLEREAGDCSTLYERHLWHPYKAGFSIYNESLA